jgi:hypothetical protein
MESEKIYIPEDLTEFLYWVKERTETFWSKNEITSNGDFVCDDWIYGAKWQGLKDSEIDEIEEKYQIKFTPDHREFLKILHTIDRKERIEYEAIDEQSEPEIGEFPFFYNWKTDNEEIEYRFDWTRRTILQDILGQNQVWLKSWGKRPSSNEEREAIFNEWLKQAPKLLPLTGHRFIVSEPLVKGNPVLSVYGSDIIVYGWNLRHYLLNELEAELGLWDYVFDEEDNMWYYNSKKEVQEIYTLEYELSKTKSIPVWEEMILYWSTGWRSFGREYPYPESQIGEFGSPIVKTYIPEDESAEDIQKRFNQF